MPRKFYLNRTITRGAPANIDEGIWPAPGPDGSHLLKDRIVWECTRQTYGIVADDAEAGYETVPVTIVPGDHEFFTLPVEWLRDEIGLQPIGAYAVQASVNRAKAAAVRAASEALRNPDGLYERREQLGADGTVRKAHYKVNARGEQPIDTISRLGWDAHFSGGCVIRYLRRDKDVAHSEESARWYYRRIKQNAAKENENPHPHTFGEWETVLNELAAELTLEEIAIVSKGDPMQLGQINANRRNRNLDELDQHGYNALHGQARTNFGDAFNQDAFDHSLCVGINYHPNNIAPKADDIVEEIVQEQADAPAPDAPPPDAGTDNEKTGEQAQQDGQQKEGDP